MTFVVHRLCPGPWLQILQRALFTSAKQILYGGYLKMTRKFQTSFINPLVVLAAIIVGIFATSVQTASAQSMREVSSLEALCGAEEGETTYMVLNGTEELSAVQNCDGSFWFQSQNVELVTADTAATFITVASGSNGTVFYMADEANEPTAPANDDNAQVDVEVPNGWIHNPALPDEGGYWGLEEAYKVFQMSDGLGREWEIDVLANHVLIVDGDFAHVPPIGDVGTETSCYLIVTAVKGAQWVTQPQGDEWAPITIPSNGRSSWELHEVDPSDADFNVFSWAAEKQSALKADYPATCGKNGVDLWIYVGESTDAMVETTKDEEVDESPAVEPTPLPSQRDNEVETTVETIDEVEDSFNWWLVGGPFLAVLFIGLGFLAGQRLDKSDKAEVTVVNNPAAPPAE